MIQFLYIQHQGPSTKVIKTFYCCNLQLLNCNLLCTQTRNITVSQRLLYTLRESLSETNTGTTFNVTVSGNGMRIL
jgi:hypothetical protein